MRIIIAITGAIILTGCDAPPNRIQVLSAIQRHLSLGPGTAAPLRSHEADAALQIVGCTMERASLYRCEITGLAGVQILRLSEDERGWYLIEWGAH